ncbi:MAG: hypothetical protein IT358_02350 [Gemmatimonadaceae bacterium]|nr:hypothetical protein [Gemmatimonadaceae bacterium]
MPQLELLRRQASRLAPITLGACLVLFAACTQTGGAPAATGDSATVADATAPDTTASTTPRPQAGNGAMPSAAPPLSPLADTVAQRLVFAPLVQDWFTAAARTKRLVVDLGRVDIDLKKDTARLVAFRAAAAARSPFAIGSRLRLRGPWGSDDATIAGFEAYNGRIVATLATSPLVDSLARDTDPLVASAQRVRNDSTPAGAACDRAVDSAFVSRLTRLARATEDSLRASEDQPLYARLKASLKARRSVAAGCFGEARGVVIVTLYAGDYEWVRERVLLVGDGSVKKATVRDLRFRAHEALHALDADGDGVDDLATRAWTPRGGGTAILSFNPTTARFERLAQGFAWER